jgi:uncharacterized repeat protein (TIGR03803 family)
MQNAKISRPRAAFRPGQYLTALVLFALAMPAAWSRSQEANLISLVALGTSTVTEVPTKQRGDLLLANDGNFYIASSAGGLGGGAIARITPSGTMTVLHSFTGSGEGALAYAKLIQASDGNLYGTTYLGGANGAGSVFRMTLAGVFTNLYSFGAIQGDAALPYTGLVEASDGSLYGTTLRGGTNDKGTVFRITTAGTASVIHSFAGSDGENPEGTLIIGADGALYGTTLQGGSGNRGVVYKITTTGTFTALYSFPGLNAFNDAGLATNTTGANPRAALLLAADGNYYGTTYQGGANGNGTVFRMTPAGVVTTLHAFTGPALGGGGFPLGAVMQDSAGNFYGTTERGGYLGRGSAWRLDGAGVFQLLHGFTGSASDGSAPHTSLLLSGGSLYGASSSDVTLGVGALFKLDLGTGGILPAEITVSPAEIQSGASATLTWTSAAASSCSAAGAWSDTIATTGTRAVTPASAGIYTYVLTCTDSATVVRNAYATLLVKAPPTQSVDGGGGGGGSTSIVLLMLLALMLLRLKFREIF